MTKTTKNQITEDQLIQLLLKVKSPYGTEKDNKALANAMRSVNWDGFRKFRKALANYLEESMPN